MEQIRRFPPMPRPRPKPSDEGCKIETRTTKNGRKISIGRGCSKEQLQMLKESGELNFKDKSEE